MPKFPARQRPLRVSTIGWLYSATIVNPMDAAIDAFRWEMWFHPQDRVNDGDGTKIGEDVAHRLGKSIGDELTLTLIDKDDSCHDLCVIIQDVVRNGPAGPFPRNYISVAAREIKEVFDVSDDDPLPSVKLLVLEAKDHSKCYRWKAVADAI